MLLPADSAALDALIGTLPDPRSRARARHDADALQCALAAARAAFGLDARFALAALDYPDEPPVFLLTIYSPYNRNGTADRINRLFSVVPVSSSFSIHFQILCCFPD